MAHFSTAAVAAAVAAMACVLAPAPVLGDLPVHCLHSEVLGMWEFHLGAVTHDKDASCGHSQPDKIMTMPNDGVDFKNPHFTVQKTTTVMLSEPNKAVDAQGKEGTWTMVYDEGFEVRIGDQKYFTFFKYAPLAPDPDPSKVTDFHSYCDTTVAGWFSAGGQDHRCFVAGKTQQTKALLFGNDRKTKPCMMGTAAGSQLVLTATPTGGDGCGKQTVVVVGGGSSGGGSSGDGDAPPTAGIGEAASPRFQAVAEAAAADVASSSSGSQRTLMTRSTSFATDATFHADTAFIDQVNANKAATWMAKAHAHLEGKAVADVLNMLGHRHFKEVTGGPEQSEHDHEHSTHHRHLHGDAVQPAAHHALLPHLLVPHVNVLTVSSGDEHNHGFPDVYDWRKIDGGVYMTPVIEQGGCGSCYAVASTDVATMRYRIKKGKNDPAALKMLFSPQNVLGCSRTNQGCDGGYPFLVGKHGVELGFVPQSCQEYTGDGACRRECLDADKVVRAKGYEYIGGYYGAGNELDMLKALKRGPIVVAVNAPPDLLYFHHGVYSHALTHDHDEYDVNGISRWEKTNHAIAAVGWGEEVLNGERVKYWICKNSWGQRWGDEGYFYVRRGSDSMAIESMAVEILF